MPLRSSPSSTRCISVLGKLARWHFTGNVSRRTPSGNGQPALTENSPFSVQPPPGSSNPQVLIRSYPSSWDRNQPLHPNPGPGNADVHQGLMCSPDWRTSLQIWWSWHLSRSSNPHSHLSSRTFTRDHPRDAIGGGRYHSRKALSIMSQGTSRWCSRHAFSSTISSEAPILSRRTGERR